jgi:preprotein translocase subunit YajC
VPPGRKAWRHAGESRLGAAYNEKLPCAGPLGNPPQVLVCQSVEYLEFVVFISSAFAQAAPAAQGDMQSTLMGMLPLVLMFVVLYFVMIRPQMKKAKEHKNMVEALAKGDEIVTSGGLLGKVTKLTDGFIGVEIASGVEVQLQRSAVVQVLPKGSIK